MLGAYGKGWCFLWGVCCEGDSLVHCHRAFSNVKMQELLDSNGVAEDAYEPVL